jgi:hypothetical protein
LRTYLLGLQILLQQRTKLVTFFYYTALSGQNRERFAKLVELLASHASVIEFFLEAKLRERDPVSVENSNISAGKCTSESGSIDLAI